MSETAISGLTNNCGGTPPGSSLTPSTSIHQNALCVSASSPSGATSSTSAPESRTLQRPRPTEQELESCSLEDLLKRWKELDSYVDYLVAQTSSQEAELSTLREADERNRAQHAEACSRERALLRRLTAKEQEVQDYAVQVQELKNSSAPGPAALRAALLDPAVNILVKKLRGELVVTRTRLEETQNELSAWKFTPDSNTGKRLMAKCRMLYQENEELGRLVSSGRMAKLEGELALQKSFSQEVKKSQSELDEFLQELDEDVEGMQSTIYYLQQELRKARATVTSLEQEISKLRCSVPTTAAVPAVTPAAVTPAAVTPAAVTPAAVTPDAATPAAATPAATQPSALPTPSEAERTLNERQDSNCKEDGVESADGNGKEEEEEETEVEGKRNERTKRGGSPAESDKKSWDSVSCPVVDRHKSDNGNRRNNTNNNNGEDISAMLGKRACSDDSDDSDDVPLSKKIRPNIRTDKEDLTDRELPLTNGKNEEK